MATIVVIGGDLFRIALKNLGDATRWIDIAQLNERDDPILDGIVTLKLPQSSHPVGGSIAE